MQPSYQWMLSPEVLKKTNNVQDSSRSNLSEQLPFNYAQTNQYINPAVGISYQNQVISIISNANQESVTIHEGDNAEKTPIQQIEITSSTENPVESNHPVDIKEENDVLTVKEEHDEKESAESVEPKVAEEPPTQSEALEGSLSMNKEESITVEKVERKRAAHFIHCSEENTEDPYRYIDPENGEKWIRCQNPFCGKWRFVPEDIEMPEKNPWFCILNTWDEEVASCTYPQLQEGCIITKKKEEPEKLWLPKRECHFEKLTAASY